MRPTVLIIDDDDFIRASIVTALGDEFDTLEADSGEAALALFNSGSAAPAASASVVLLDIEMQQLDGYETCRRLREAGHAMPVIFVSSHDTLEERLYAFDAGGDDFLSKPYDAAELLRKTQRASLRHRQQESLQAVTGQILHEIGETGVMLGFLREAIRITDYEQLGRLLMQSVGEYGVRCDVQLRHNDGVCTLTKSGQPTELELGILERAATLGERFRFGRRLVFNFPIITVLAMDLPQDEARALRLADYLEILVESAEAIAETIGVRRESALRAESLMVASSESFSAIEELREGYRKQQADTRILLQELIEQVEHTYVHLGLTEGQEEIISSTMRTNAEKILRLFERSVAFEAQFTAVLGALKPNINNAMEVWL